jgi:enoyl-CoA hydratase/carnithine racemase
MAISEDAKKWNDLKTWNTITLKTNQLYPEIGLMTLNRPEKFNAMDAEMINDTNECFNFLMRAFDCRVLILNGAGKLFCSGVDLSFVGADTEGTYEWQKFQDRIKKVVQRQEEIGAMFLNVRKIPQPVIAAVHGAAVGLGIAFTNAADLVFAGKGTRFINAFIKIGVSGAECGTSFFLPRILGFHRSNELLYSGRDFLAEEAYQWGYVNKIIENPGEVVDSAVEFAAEMMLSKSPLGLRFTKDAINAGVGMKGLEETIRFENRTQLLAGESTDFQEAIKAFFEKRLPKFGTR